MSLERRKVKKISYRKAPDELRRRIGMLARAPEHPVLTSRGNVLYSKKATSGVGVVVYLKHPNGNTPFCMAVVTGIPPHIRKKVLRSNATPA